MGAKKMGAANTVGKLIVKKSCRNGAYSGPTDSVNDITRY